MFQYLGIVIAATFGFSVSAYIWHKKNHSEKLVCFLGEDCNKVVYSRYSTTFGISNEVIGMLYYGGITVAYSLAITGLIPFFFGWLISITGIAALFSIYLISVQLVILKEWCEWCVASAITSIIIFTLVII